MRFNSFGLETETLYPVERFQESNGGMSDQDSYVRDEVVILEDDNLSSEGKQICRGDEKSHITTLESPIYAS